MIPETAGALLAFLALVAPGIVYRTVHERRRPPRRESTLVETSRIALTSLVFSLAALAVLWLLQATTPVPLPDVGTWLGQGTKYAAANFGKVFTGLAAEVAVACGLAATTAWLVTRRSTSRFRDDTAYGMVFRRFAPAGFKPWVYVLLDNGVEYWGYERAHDDREGGDAHRIVLDGQGLRRQRPGEPDWEAIGDSWDVVVLDAERIWAIQVIYRNKAGQLAGARSEEHPQGRLRKRPDPAQQVAPPPPVNPPTVEPPP